MHLSSAETYSQKHNHTMSNTTFWAKKDIKFKKRSTTIIMYTFIVRCVHKCRYMKSISQNQGNLMLRKAHQISTWMASKHFTSKYLHLFVNWITMLSFKDSLESKEKLFLNIQNYWQINSFIFNTLLSWQQLFVD